MLDINQPDLIDSNFTESNNLTYLSERGDFLINWLLKNEVINDERILTFGHSQGGTEAIRVASINIHVTDVVILNSAPFGRSQHAANNFYLQYLLGEIDFKTYLERQKQIYKYIEDAKNPAENLKTFPISNKNILDFQQHAFTDMMKTEANIFYVTGTRDIASFYVDQVIIDATLKGKNNIRGKIFEDTEHSFFKVEPSGEVNYEIDFWDEVFEDILEWFDGNDE